MFLPLFSLVRSRAAFCCLLSCLMLLSVRAWADTTVQVVNPQPNDIISSRLSPSMYVINGISHNADEVQIDISGAGAVSQTVPVRGNVWEYAWVVPPNTIGSPIITVTPLAHGVPAIGAQRQVAVNVTNSYPAGVLYICPSGVTPSVYIAAAAVTSGANVRGANDSFTTGIKLSYVVDNLPTTPANKNITLSAAFANNVSVAFNAATIKTLNDDGTANSLPTSFTLGNNPANSLQPGITTISALLFSNNGAADVSQTFKRSVIVDNLAPDVPAPILALFTVSPDSTALALPAPASNVVRLCGKAHDAGDVVGVEVVILYPDGTTTERLPAQLVYGNTSADTTTWYADFSVFDAVGNAFKGTGLFNAYALIRDNAGNVTRDVLTSGFTVNNFNSNATTITLNHPNAGLPAQDRVKGTILLTGTVSTPVSGTTAVHDFDRFNIEVRDAANTLQQTLFSSASAASIRNKHDGTYAISYQWDSSGVADGVVTLTLNAFDKANNSKSSSLGIYVINNAPTFSFTQLQSGHGAARHTITAANIPGAVVGGGTNNADIPDKVAVSFSIVTSNGPHLAAWTLTANGTVIATNATHTPASTTGGFYSYNNVLWNTTDATDGPVTLTLTATDTTGTTASQSVRVLTDNTKPMIYISGLTGTVVAGQTFTVTYSDANFDTNSMQTTNLAVNPNHFTLKINNVVQTAQSVEQISASGPVVYRATYLVTNNVTGPQQFDASATDLPGNTGNAAAVLVTVSAASTTLTSVSFQQQNVSNALVNIANSDLRAALSSTQAVFVRGVMDVYGSVNDAGLNQWSLDFLTSGSTSTNIALGTVPVQQSNARLTVSSFDTIGLRNSSLPPLQYVLQLRDYKGALVTINTKTALVVVDNQPPTATLQVLDAYGSTVPQNSSGNYYNGKYYINNDPLSLAYKNVEVKGALPPDSEGHIVKDVNNALQDTSSTGYIGIFDGNTEKNSIQRTAATADNDYVTGANVSYSLAGSQSNAISEGEHTYQVIAIDRAGNRNLTPPTATIIIDRTLPVISFSGIGGVAVQGQTFHITYSDANFDSSSPSSFSLNYSDATHNRVVINPDAGTIVPTSTAPPTYFVTYRIPADARGNVTFSAAAQDLASNTSTITSKANVLSGGSAIETVSFTQQTISGSTNTVSRNFSDAGGNPVVLFVRGSIDLFGKVNDPDMDNWTLQVSGNTATQIIGRNSGPDAPPLAFTSEITALPTATPFDTTVVSNSGQPAALFRLDLITYKSPGRVGLIRDVTRYIVVDNQVPIVAANVLVDGSEPAYNGDQGLYINHTTHSVVVKAKVTNKTGSIAGIPIADQLGIYSVSGTAIGAAVTSPANGVTAVDYPVPSAGQSKLADGVYTYEVIAVDRAGNRNASDPFKITFDSTKPSATLSLAQNQFVGGQINLIANVADNLTPAAELTFSLKVKDSAGQSVFPSVNSSGVTNANGSVSNTGQILLNGAVPVWDTTNVSDGKYTVTLDAIDKAGNASPQATAEVDVQNNSPTALLTLQPIAPATTANVFRADGYSETAALDSNLLGTRYINKTTTFQLRGDYMAANKATLSGFQNNVKFLSSASRLITPADLTTKHPTFTVIYPPPFGSGDGLFQFSAIATTAGGATSNAAQISIVRDSVPPNVTIISPPANNISAASVFPVRPATFLTLHFTVNNKTGAGTSDTSLIAPLRRYSDTSQVPTGPLTLFNEPFLTLSITDTTINQSVQPPTSDSKWLLHTALTSPKTDQATGFASLSGDSASGFDISWQLLMSPAVFKIGHTYRIDVTGVQDIVGNTASKVSTYFTVSVR